MCAIAGATMLVNFRLKPDIFIDEGRFLSITTERLDKSVNIYAVSEILLTRIVFE